MFIGVIYFSHYRQSASLYSHVTSEFFEANEIVGFLVNPYRYVIPWIFPFYIITT